MDTIFLTIAYLVASVFFILSLRGLSSQETAAQGNVYGILGMIIAVGATLSASAIDSYVGTVLGLAIGAVIGFSMAARVAMTGC